MKKIISFILALVLILSLSSCSIDLGFNKLVYKKHFVATAAEKINVSYLDYRQDGYAEFLDKLDSFVARLSYEVYSDARSSKNFAISPISIYMALALATECASGETREEILNAVGVTYDEVKSFTKYLYAFSNRTFYSSGGKWQISAREQLSNSIWADNDIKLNQSGVNNLANNYNCDLFSVDFGGKKGNRAINAYIKDKTYGVIDGGVQLSPETLITLINVFYLKDIWNPYGNNLSFADKSYAFTNADGSTVNTNLLKGYYNHGKVYEGEGYTSFYTTTEHGYEIKFIVPADGYALDDVFTAENVYNINNVTDYGYVDDENRLLHNTRVLFPEYNASFDGNIANTLREDFGIEKLFSFYDCDFSNITDETVACEGVIHKCILEVNRKGIEGAAVTYIPGATSAGPGEYENVYHDFIVDRAFGFVITDSYDVVLFCGVVNSVV